MAKILVVDDAWVTRQTIRAILIQDGHSIHEAVNGEDAVAAVKKETFDTIILDLLMPEMDGFVVLQKLRDAGSRTPVVIHSSDIQDSTRETCIALGAAAFFNKPVTAHGLRQVMASVLAPDKE